MEWASKDFRASWSIPFICLSTEDFPVALELPNPILLDRLPEMPPGTLLIRRQVKRMRTGISHSARRFPLFAPLVLVLLVACNLLVHVPVAHEPTTVPDAATPLTAGELLRFAFDNLGEVSPGLLYRSSRPGRALLEFLTREKKLRFVINLTGKIPDVEREVMEAAGGEIVHLRMSTSTPPRADQIIDFIRTTPRRANAARRFSSIAAPARIEPG